MYVGHGAGDLAQTRVTEEEHGHTGSLTRDAAAVNAGPFLACRPAVPWDHFFAEVPMAHLRFTVLLLALALVGCGGRAGPMGGHPDGGTAGDAHPDGVTPVDGPGPGCPSSAPADGAACSSNGTHTCDYPLPGPCPGAIDVCRCMNGSWACQVTLLDGGCPQDAPIDVDANLPAFCTGGFPRMIANGNESNPAVNGTVLPLNCCDAAEFVVVTETVPVSLVPIVVMWRAQVGQATLPATIDLANPPAGWGVQVDVGCDPMQGSCNPAPDSYTTGLTGTLQVTRTSAGGYEMDLCLAVAEPGGTPHPLLHSLQLYAPHIAAGY